MPGASTLSQNNALVAKVKEYLNDENKRVGAICAAPAVVLQRNGLLNPKFSATCHPAFEKEIPNYSSKRVVVHENVITSQGPGTALEFALELVKALFGEEKAKEVGDPMIVK